MASATACLPPARINRSSSRVEKRGFFVGETGGKFLRCLK
jgi:hypothetical protein